MSGKVAALRLVIVSVLAVLLAACSGGGSAGAKLPEGKDLLAKSAEAMKTVKTVSFNVASQGQVAIPLKRGTGKLTREGNAQGDAQIEFAGQLVEVNFVILGDTVYFKGATGGYQKVPRAQLTAIFDPSAVLDPNRGVVLLLSQATNAQTEVVESIGGRDTYRVKATMTADGLKNLVPGVKQAVTGQLWIDKENHRLLKSTIPVPALSGQGTSGTATVTLTEYDAPVDIKPPAGS